jgi:anthranilate phosphoribosyltransferase
VTPAEVGLDPVPDGTVRAGSPDDNARVLRGVLAGEPGPERSLAVLNAAAAIQVAGRADSLADGVRGAEQAIDSGAALGVLERWVEVTRA